MNFKYNTIIFLIILQTSLGLNPSEEIHSWTIEQANGTSPQLLIIEQNRLNPHIYRASQYKKKGGVARICTNDSVVAYYRKCELRPNCNDIANKVLIGVVKKNNEQFNLFGQIIFANQVPQLNQLAVNTAPAVDVIEVFTTAEQTYLKELFNLHAIHQAGYLFSKGNLSENKSLDDITKKALDTAAQQTSEIFFNEFASHLTNDIKKEQVANLINKIVNPSCMQKYVLKKIKLENLDRVFGTHKFLASLLVDPKKHSKLNKLTIAALVACFPQLCIRVPDEFSESVQKVRSNITHHPLVALGLATTLTTGLGVTVASNIINTLPVKNFMRGSIGCAGNGSRLLLDGLKYIKTKPDNKTTSSSKENISNCSGKEDDLNSQNKKSPSLKQDFKDIFKASWFLGAFYATVSVTKAVGKYLWERKNVLNVQIDEKILQNNIGQLLKDSQTQVQLKSIAAGQSRLEANITKVLVVQEEIKLEIETLQTNLKKAIADNNKKLTTSLTDQMKTLETKLTFLNNRAEARHADLMKAICENRTPPLVAATVTAVGSMTNRLEFDTGAITRSILGGHNFPLPSRSNEP